MWPPLTARPSEGACPLPAVSHRKPPLPRSEALGPLEGHQGVTSFREAWKVRFRCTQGCWRQGPAKDWVQKQVLPQSLDPEGPQGPGHPP